MTQDTNTLEGVRAATNTVTVPGRLLVVAPNDADTSLLRSKLEALGHEVHHASTWDDATSWLTTAPAVFTLVADGHPAAPDGLNARLGHRLPMARGEIGDPMRRAAESAVRIHPQDDPRFLAAQLEMAADVARLQERCAELVEQVQALQTGESLIGNTPAIRRLQSVLHRAGEGDATVLIEGQAGTGRSLVAQLLHEASPRGTTELETVDASTLNVAELEKTLARTGTAILLEKVETLPSDGQARLVRFLKEAPARRADDAGDAVPTGVRFLATTSARLPELVARGAFREDLFYRLNVFSLQLPSLRERKEDIGLLVRHFIHRHAAAAGRTKLPALTPNALSYLESQPWPGNVRELEKAVLRSLTMCGDGSLEAAHFSGDAPHTNRSATPPTASQSEARPERSSVVNAGAEAENGDVSESDIRTFKEEEQLLLSRALRATKGNVRRAAKLLGIGRATLYRKIQIYKLNLGG